MADLHVFTTGGTIDKIYFDRLSEFQVGGPQIVDLLREANVRFSWTLTPLMRKDSLELTDADRAAIVAAVRDCAEPRVLVTHGTDTMIATARALAAAALDKTVVLTGAMQPATQRGSDAVFNIGFAIGVLRTLPGGVHLAMNGEVFRPDAVRKNRQANRFEPSVP
jgi:L-asparaginase